jgi:hypothetical protein
MPLDVAEKILLTEKIDSTLSKKESLMIFISQILFLLFEHKVAEPLSRLVIL